MQKAGRFSALHSRDFRMFWFGQIVSLSGTWMQSVAQGWLVYSLTRSPLYLGLVAAANSLPILLFTLFGGVIADRFPKRTVLLVTQALSIVPALLLGVLTSLGVITVLQVAVIAAVLGTINAIDVPARQAFLAQIVGREHIVNAIALNSAAFNGARIIGPMIAGLSITYLGMPACFYLNAASFLAVIIGLSRIESRGEGRGSSAGIVEEFSAGIRFIRERSDVVDVIALIAVFSLIGLPYITLLPVFAAEILGQGPRGLGFLVGASGIGAFTAAVSIAARGDMRNKMRFMSVAALSFSAAMIVFSSSRSFEISLAALMTGGWGMVSYLATANGYIQVSVPDELRGRVMSVYSFVFLGTMPLGNALMGTMASLVGTPEAVRIAAFSCLLASGIFARRHLRRSP